MDESRAKQSLWPPVATLVPHQGPMCLLDHVVDVDGERIVVAVIPSSTDLFADERGVPVQIALEWMAQASAAWSTLQPREGGTPRQGMLLGARRFEARVDDFPFDQSLEIVLAVDTLADSGLGTFDGLLYRPGDNPERDWLARANLSVLQTGAA
ncbi:ApeP family dehydratase [Kushneria sp. EE4]